MEKTISRLPINYETRRCHIEFVSIYGKRIEKIKLKKINTECLKVGVVF
jgi:hypothetical protein